MSSPSNFGGLENADPIGLPSTFRHSLAARGGAVQRAQKMCQLYHLASYNCLVLTSLSLPNPM